MILPTIQSREDYVQVYADDTVWLPAMRILAARRK
jgi:hypothetical protein